VQVGRPLATGLAAEGCGEVGEVSLAVAAWVQQVGQFLGVVQAVLEQSQPHEDASAELRAVALQLPALIRQCRAQVPTPDMIHTWVQTLAAGPRPHAVGGHVTPNPFVGATEAPSFRAS
jgi:hypothetical protein